MTGHDIWARHPHVRTGRQLAPGERAADTLKKWFGTWTLLGLVIGGCVAVLLLVNDPGHLKLNLALSLMAAVQGIILQISANRGDRIAAEVARGTYESTQRIEREVTALRKALGTRRGGEPVGKTTDGGDW